MNGNTGITSANSDGRQPVVAALTGSAGSPARGPGIIKVRATRPVRTGCAPPSQPVECQVQVRAHGEVHDLDGASVRIRLYRPARGVTMGPAAVLYLGDAVLGSVTIGGTSTAPRQPR